MKRFIAAIALFAATLIVAPSALAGDWYFGASAGKMMFDQSGIDDATNVGVVAGYEVGVVLGDLGFEGEVTRTMDKGSYNNADVDIDTAAAYLVLRTAGPIYFKARGGYLYEDVTIGSESSNDSGVSYGAGLGFSIGLTRLELDYTVIEEDINYLSLGIQF